jgi:uncharacterized protein
MSAKLDDKPDTNPDTDGAAIETAYQRALEEGRLIFPRCEHCAHAWPPPRDECPRCLEAKWRWDTASGKGKLVTWCVYHIAYSPDYQGRLPYNVAVVELDEGPRLVTNVIDADEAALKIDVPVTLVVEREKDIAVPRFRLA